MDSKSKTLSNLLNLRLSDIYRSAQEGLLPPIASQYNGHYLFGAKNQGASKKLVGNVRLFFIFADDTETKWSDADKCDFLDKASQAMAFLESEAKRYNTELHLSLMYDCVSYSYSILQQRNTSFSSNVLALMKQRYGVEGTEQFQEKHEKEFNINEIPIIIVSKHIGRSCAHVKSKSFPTSTNEWSLITKHSDGFFHPTIIAHEILHQFGAEDLYLPKKVYKKAMKFFPRSIMISYDTVDPLTAFVIGWTRDLDKIANKFMKSVRKVTVDDYLEAFKIDHQKNFIEE